jgi:WD40 repeat protein
MLENSNCFYIISRDPRVYTAQHDSLIKARDFVSLYLLESYIGHQDSVFAICFDETGTLYSSSFDGTIKKWNMASRKVAFSFENRNGSVTALTAADSLLFIGNKNGALNCFSIEDSFLVATTQLHKGELTSLIIFGNHILSTGNDGVFAKSTLSLDNTTVQMDSRPSSVKCLGMIKGMLFMMRGENEIVFIHQYDTWGSVRTIITNTPLTSIAAN